MKLSRLFCLLVPLAALPLFAQTDKSWESFTPHTAAQKEVIALARKSEAGKELSAAALPRKYEKLREFMSSYKSRPNKGVGVGPRSPSDGIEMKIISLAKRAPTAATLRKESADLIRMGHVNLALAEIARVYPPKPKGKKGKKEWDDHCDDMKAAAEALVKAVKDDDPAATTKAAKSLLNACMACHKDFRD